MAICWLSGIALTWAPILTFERRRNAVLEWVEENLEPVAFHDGDHTLGLAFGEPDARIILGQRSMILSSGASGLPMRETLGPALEGVLQILEPARVRIRRLSHRSSAAINGLTYPAATGLLARHRLFLDDAHKGLLPSDVAVLADVSDEHFSGQIEFGVVNRSELAERVYDSGIGRIDSLVEAPDQQSLMQRIEAVDEDVLLFMDSALTPARENDDVTAADIWEEHHRASERVIQLVGALAAGLEKESGDKQ